MGEAEREDWLSVAMSELLRPPSVPNAYFQEACAHARRVCDHPSKIVPAIFGYNPGPFLNRSSMEKELRDIRAEIENMDRPRIAANEGAGICTPAEAKEILAKFGMSSAFDGSAKPKRELRMPTAEELAEVAASFKRSQGYTDD